MSDVEMDNPAEDNNLLEIESNNSDTDSDSDESDEWTAEGQMEV